MAHDISGDQTENQTENHSGELPVTGVSAALLAARERTNPSTSDSAPPAQSERFPATTDLSVLYAAVAPRRFLRRSRFACLFYE
ncbi:hypothetical protein SH449x_003309 [Pirellulaceae bacterium SH449]